MTFCLLLGQKFPWDWHRCRTNFVIFYCADQLLMWPNLFQEIDRNTFQHIQDTQSGTLTHHLLNLAFASHLNHLFWMTPCIAICYMSAVKYRKQQCSKAWRKASNLINNTWDTLRTTFLALWSPQRQHEPQLHSKCPKIESSKPLQTLLYYFTMNTITIKIKCTLDWKSFCHTSLPHYSNILNLLN